MGPIPKRSFIVEPQPLKTVDRATHFGSRLFRRLPPALVRFFAVCDVALCILPFWAWFAYRRWSGMSLSATEMRERYLQGIRFMSGQLAHTGGGTGIDLIKWKSKPIRGAHVTERADYADKGTCGSCRNCCTTHWLPEPVACPFLGEDGCRVYGGVWWDYFNCGRYPAEPVHTIVYDCPRFERPIEIPDALPESVGAEVPARV